MPPEPDFAYFGIKLSSIARDVEKRHTETRQHIYAIVAMRLNGENQASSAYRGAAKSLASISCRISSRARWVPQPSSRHRRATPWPGRAWYQTKKCAPWYAWATLAETHDWLFSRARHSTCEHSHRKYRWHAEAFSCTASAPALKVLVDMSPW